MGKWGIREWRNGEIEKWGNGLTEVYDFRSFLFNEFTI
jgi:hypothetical protein